MSNYCNEYEDKGKPCGLLSDCPECRSCWAHCPGHYDDSDCRHGVSYNEKCDACKGLSDEPFK